MTLESGNIFNPTEQMNPLLYQIQDLATVQTKIESVLSCILKSYLRVSPFEPVVRLLSIITLNR